MEFNTNAAVSDSAATHNEGFTVQLIVPCTCSNSQIRQRLIRSLNRPPD